MTTDITELAQSLKAAAINVKETAHIARYSKATIARQEFNELMTSENILALVEALEKAQQRIAELEPIRAAAEKLVRCKGRYHSEPVAWTDEEELRDVNVAGIGYLFGIDREANKFADPRRQIMLYRHAQPALDVVGKLLAILDRHTVELGWGEKPITLAELVIARDGSDELDACRTVTFQAGNSPVIPDGYVIVPKEPTQAMCAAFNDSDYGRKSLRERYVAMLAAADCSIPMISDRWVPVSERMPERGDYLVTDGRDFDVQSFDGEQFIPGFVWEDAITHWMPLPAAPQEVKP